MDAWLLRMLALRKKHKTEGVLFKTSDKDEMADYILPLREQISEIKGILARPQSSIFLVTIPEKLGVMKQYRTSFPQ